MAKKKGIGARMKDSVKKGMRELRDSTGKQRAGFASGLLGVVLTILSVMQKFTEVFQVNWLTPIWLIIASVVFLVLGLCLAYTHPWIQGIRKFLRRRGNAIAPSAPFVHLLGIVGVIAALVWISLVCSRLHHIGHLSATRYIGKFPDNMKAINQLIGNTQRELIVACDFALYGGFSSPSDCREYKKLLEEVGTSEKHVELLWYNENTAAVARAEEFGYSINDNPSDPKFVEMTKSERWKRYFRLYPKAEKPKNWEGFDRLLSKENEAFAGTMEKTGAKVDRIRGRLPAFVWIRDGQEEAIFSLCTVGSGAREISFHTRDVELIGFLRDIVKSHRELPRGEGKE